jgi:hypothetical protein
MEITTRNPNTIVALPSLRTGKVSKGDEKAAVVLQDASKLALISAAINGKGAVRKVALQNLTGVQSVEAFTSLDALDGSQWGDFLAALVARHGVGDFNRQTMRGKSGAGAYMDLVCTSLDVAYRKCETVAAQDRVQRKIAQAETDRAHVERLFTARIEA